MQDLQIEPFGSATLVYGYRLGKVRDLLAFEIEGQWTQHFEALSRFSLNSAFVVRWLSTPWSSLTESSFAFGNGLSWANRPPQIEEETLGKTNRLLYHLFFEFTLPLKTEKWETYFRVHHRSGAFGLFDGVTGGSDFLCLGVRTFL